MANGRALPSALLFDWLLGRAWNMAMTSYANAQNFSANDLEGPQETGVSAGSGGPTIEKFLSRYAGNEAAALVGAHDQSLRGQMQDVANEWATQFQAVMTNAAPVGPGFQLAIAWLRKVVNGGDGLGYLGQDRRLSQAMGYASQDVNPYSMPLPPGALTALQGVAARTAGLHVDRLGAQMQADRAAEAHKLRIDAAEALLRAYNAALDAVMEHMFTQMHLMFDVFGRNAASIQRIKASVERGNTLAQMSADANIKLLRRYSSRAAAALNSAGVSVNSTASESNNINAGS